MGEAALEVQDEGFEGVGVGGGETAEDEAFDCAFLEELGVGEGGGGWGVVGFVGTGEAEEAGGDAEDGEEEGEPEGVGFGWGEPEGFVLIMSVSQ